MKYPKGPVYKALYQRFFDRSPKELLGDLDPNGKFVLDLCGGDGRLTQYVHGRGASPIYVDAEPDMAPTDWLDATPASGVARNE